MDTSKVKLIAPAKVGGKRLAPGTEVDVTAAVALQLAECGAMEITSSDLEKLRAVVAGSFDIDRLSTEFIAPIVELMEKDETGELKTKTGKWSAAAISKALGRTVTQEEIDKAALLASSE